MKAFILRIALAAFVLQPSPVLASVENKPVKDRSQPLQIDPARAYILVEAVGTPMLSFYRVADDAVRAAYEAERSEAFEKVRKKYEKKLARYEQALAAWKKRGSSSSLPEPTKPDEVTEQNFGYPDIEATNMVVTGPFNRYSNNGHSLYLQEVDPGDYVFYKATGVCACMGTVKFHAAAGVVTAFGRVGASRDEWEALPQRTRMQGESMHLPPVGAEGIPVVPASAEPLDARLAADQYVAADLKPVGWLPNWTGEGVNRVNPFEGLIDYDRYGEVLGIEPKSELVSGASDEILQEAAEDDEPEPGESSLYADDESTTSASD